MRITGGLSRGRTLLGPKDRRIRPTADRVREAVFNLLGQDLSGSHVLDLFSGTGSLGLEALSRGAVQAVFVDRAQASIALIKKNIERLGYGTASRVLMMDLGRGIPWAHPFLNGPFDVVFLDPPYGDPIAARLVAEIPAEEHLARGARVVIETVRRTDLPPSLGRVTRLTERIYGDTKITVYEFTGFSPTANAEPLNPESSQENDNE